MNPGIIILIIVLILGLAGGLYYLFVYTPTPEDDTSLIKAEEDLAAALAAQKAAEDKLQKEIDSNTQVAAETARKAKEAAAAVAAAEASLKAAQDAAALKATQDAVVAAAVEEEKTKTAIVAEASLAPLIAIKVGQAGGPLRQWVQPKSIWAGTGWGNLWEFSAYKNPEPSTERYCISNAKTVTDEYLDGYRYTNKARSKVMRTWLGKCNTGEHTFYAYPNEMPNTEPICASYRKDAGERSILYDRKTCYGDLDLGISSASNVQTAKTFWVPKIIHPANEVPSISSDVVALMDDKYSLAFTKAQIDAGMTF